MIKKIISTQKAPAAIGPYSQAVLTGGLLFTSGQLGVDAETGKLVEGGIAAQCEAALNNLKNVLAAAGSGAEDVLKVTVFLKDMKDFGEMNEVYSDFFKVDPPARSCIQAGALPLGADIEIEATAIAGASAMKD